MLTIKQSAKKLGVHWQTVRNYIDRGELKSYKVGKLIKIKEQDLEDFINHDEKIDTNNNLEVELRYEVKSPRLVQEKLLNLGAKIIYQAHIIDHWFVPNYVKSRKDHDVWFDQKRGWGLRIREQDNGYTGKMTTSMEIKRLTKSMSHDAFIESEVTVDNYVKAKSFVELMDRKEFLTIDKNRILYEYKDFKIAIDEIKGYGTGIEIEAQNAKSQKSATVKIEKLAKTLGIKNSEKAEKSVTVNAMSKLAKFND